MENNESLYFNCTACGKCCTSPPSFTSNEFLNFIDKFPFSIYVEHNPLKNEKFFINQKESYAKIKSIPNNFFMVYFSSIDFRPLFTNSIGCNQLKDNLCSLHDNKPLKCKVVPFVNYYPEESQVEIFNALDKSVVRREGCFTKENKPNYIKIYENKKIINESFKNDFDLYESYLKNQKEDMEEFLTYIQKYGFFEKAGMKYYLNPSFYLSFLCFEKDKISLADFVLYLEKQNEQYDLLINKNLLIKDKTDKETTNLCKTFLNQNLKFINDLKSKS